MSGARKKKRLQISLKSWEGTCRKPLRSCHQAPKLWVENNWIWVICFKEKLVLYFNVFYSEIVYCICHWKTFFLYSSPEFWKTFSGLFYCCQKFQSKGPLTETLYLFFLIPRSILETYEPKSLLDRHVKAYKILLNIWKMQFYFLHSAWICA